MNELKPGLFLAIDQGGRSSRAAAFDASGVCLARQAASVATTHPREGWVEQDAEAVLDSICMALAGLFDKLGPDSSQFIAAGLATQRSSIVCWDARTGKALSPLISWQDRRAAAWLDAYAAHAEPIHQSTGLFLSPHYGASKFRWCLDHLAAVRDTHGNARLAWGPLASFLAFRLLEERPHIIDPANASRTMLWNMESRDWDANLLHLFGLPLEPFPRCMPTCAEFGHLPQGNMRIPMRVITGDQSAALFSQGRPRLSTAYVTVGTGAFIQRPMMRRSLSPRFLTSTVLISDECELYALEGTVNGAASAIDWFEQQFGMTEVVQKLDEWFARDAEPPLFLNGIGGLGSPFWQSDFRSRFIGEGEPWQKAVSLIESIVFLLQANLNGMAAHLPFPDRIQIGGGLARLDGLCQRLADVSGLPVQRPDESEATARGTAQLLAGCPESWGNAGKGQIFRPQHHPALRRRYESMQRELLRALG
ncbi:MAG: FGGY family carbohydrate kinase [Mariprofundaceae bacterium]